MNKYISYINFFIVLAVVVIVAVVISVNMYWHFTSNSQKGEHYCNLLSSSYDNIKSKLIKVDSNKCNKINKLCEDNKVYLESDLNICNCDKITPIQSHSESNPQKFTPF